jgi:Domain of unknown function (DUF4173)
MTSEDQSRGAWWVLLLSLGLGVVGNLLVPGPWGINIGMWVLLLVGSALWVSRKTYSIGGSIWFIVAVLLAFALAWRDSPVLNAINIGAAMVALAFGATARGHGLRFGFFRSLMALLVAFSSWIGGWLGLLIADLPWRNLIRDHDPKHWAGLARGLLITLPLLLVFGGLLTSADAAFGRLLLNLFSWRLDGQLVTRLTLIFLWFTFACGVLRLSVKGAQPLQSFKLPKLGLLEISMALGALNLLFLAFIAVQFGYFFGGNANVTALTGLTYAEYARRGSTELIQVVALTLPVLIAALHLRETEPETVLTVRVLSSITLGLLGVMLISAWQRLELYRAAYGLTEIRFYTAAFIVWLAGMILWFAATALRERYQLFPRGAMVGAFTAVFLLNTLNPSAMIVNANLNRALIGQEFDTVYAMKLGADGVTALLNGVGTLNKSPLELVGTSLWTEKADSLRFGDWRSFNFSKQRAVQLLEAIPRP